MSNRSVRGQFHPQPEDDSATRVKKFLGRNLIMIIALVLLAVTLVTLTGTMNDRKETLRAQEAEILALGLERTSLDQKAETHYEQALRDATGGMDPQHKAEDDKLVTDLMSTALTWDGLPAYLDTRETVMRVYKFEEDSQFMSVFLPGEAQGVARTDGAGKKHYVFDKDISNRFERITTYVTDVNGDVYSYVGVVTMRTNSTGGAASSLATVRVSYDVVDERIVNMEADVVTGGVKNSG